MSEEKPKRGSEKDKRQPRQQFRVMVNGQEIDISQGDSLTSDFTERILQYDEVIVAPGGARRGKRRGCSLGGLLLGLIILAGTLVGVGGLLIGIAAMLNVDMSGLIRVFAPDIPVPETRAVSGDASRFDPFDSLSDVQAFAGDDARLAAISATYVRSDGTMDLTASNYRPTVTYEFLLEVERPDDAPPVGVNGQTDGQWYEPITIRVYEPGQRRQQTTTSGGVRSTFQYTNQGMDKQTSDPTTNPFDDPAPQPECTAQQLWETAIEEGAPRDAVAIIDYDADGYTFNISGTIYLRFGLNCRLDS